MSNKNFKQSRFMDDAILNVDAQSTGAGALDLASNITYSGQVGSGIRFTKLDGATPAVFNPTVIVVLNTPSMWERFPKAQAMLRAIIETHATSVTNIDFGYTLETAETVVGHDGQTLKVPTRTTRSSVEPSIEVPEYPGMPVYNLFKQWMFDIQHPDTNASVLPSKMLANGGDTFNINSAMSANNFTDMPGWYVSAYSMSIAIIQYDPSGLPDRIYDAAIITNMFPTSIGDVGFNRQIGTTEMKPRTIQFTGLIQHNEMTKALGVNIAKMLSMHKVDYDFALPGLAGSSFVKDDSINASGGSNINNAFNAHTKVGPKDSGLHYELNGAHGSVAEFQPTSQNNTSSASGGTNGTASMFTDRIFQTGSNPNGTGANALGTDSSKAANKTQSASR